MTCWIGTAIPRLSHSVWVKGQRLEYVRGHGFTRKYRAIDVLKHVFAAREINSIFKLRAHPVSEQLLCFSEAKKWTWEQKLAFMTDEISMLVDATFFKTYRYLQTLRDYPNKPSGGILVVPLMSDSHQFAPVLEASLLVDQTLDLASTTSSGQKIIARHRSYNLRWLFTITTLLEEQVPSGDDPELFALLNRVWAATQTMKQNLDPARRITAREALEYPWFRLAHSRQKTEMR
ncbi:hypothetical protein F4861DRAFT_541727 [Xylaria intraflava]|nr:hypothetical protein F4861DRAFT_541727 [Xylaria intraflava]